MRAFLRRRERFIVRKADLISTEALVSRTPKVAPSFGFWRSWSLVVGTPNRIRRFFIPTVLASYGGLGVVSVAAAGLGGLSIALTLSGLSRRVSGSGEPYTYVRAGFGDFAGFLTAWVYWASLWASGGAIATAIPLELF